MPIKLAVKTVSSKPTKPHKDFPLTPHPSGRWCKKVRGKLAYFGPWSDPDAALAKWLEQKDDLLAGRTPRASGDGLTVRDLCNQFLTSKQQLLDNHEITFRTFYDYHAICCEWLVKVFGRTRLVVDLASDDFARLRGAWARTWGPVRLANEINRARVVFKYAFDAGLIDRPVRYGPGFKRPSFKTLRQARAKKAPRLFEANQLRELIAAAGVPLKAMLLLGINCGLGNSDVAQMEFRHIDQKTGWLRFPRPKTGIDRRSPLWSETAEAIEAAIEQRPTPKAKAHEQLVFVTSHGLPWGKASADNPIAKETSKLLKRLGMKQPGLGFYALRHTTETVGGGVRDQVALNHVMGHAPAGSDMAAVYRERIEDARLLAVSDHLHRWLFSKSSGGKRLKPR
jgi:integrase